MRKGFCTEHGRAVQEGGRGRGRSRGRARGGRGLGKRWMNWSQKPPQNAQMKKWKRESDE